MSNHEEKRVEWWLMDTFPDLNWARLTVFPDGRAEVFDCDGRTTPFESEQDATDWLFEDEFTRYATLTEERVAPLRLDQVTPPVGASDRDLLPRMLVRWT